MLLRRSCIHAGDPAACATLTDWWRELSSARAMCGRANAVLHIPAARTIESLVHFVSQEMREMVATKKRGNKYGRAAEKSVASAMRRRKRGTLRSGPGGKGGRVKSREQAIAIGLSEARKKGAKVPRKSAPRKRARKRSR
jgi:hypothetical protein